MVVNVGEIEASSKKCGLHNQSNFMSAIEETETNQRIQRLIWWLEGGGRKEGDEKLGAGSAMVVVATSLIIESDAGSLSGFIDLF